MCGALGSRQERRITDITCVARLPHGFKNDVYYMYSALVSLMALRTTYITCSALVSPHFYVCCELTFR